MRKFFNFVLSGMLIFSFLFFVLEKSVEASWAENIVISEVQITGGTGKTANDFIELYNPTDSIIDLSGWRLRKRTKSGAGSSIRVFPQGKIIPAYGFFLWANSNDDFHLSVEADEWSTATIASNNSIALFDDLGNLIDALAWGSDHSNPFMETRAFSINPEANQSIERKASQYSSAITLGPGGQEENSGNGWQTNDNAADFVLQTKPNPQNNFSLKENQPALAQPLPEEVLIKELLPNGLKIENDPSLTPTTSTKKQKIILETPLSEVKNRNIGDLVKVQGIVSVEPGVLGVQIFYLSEFGSGVQIYSFHKDFPVLRVGNKVEVVGEVSQTRGETRVKISSRDDIRILASEASLTAYDFLTGEINKEKEGSLVKVVGQMIEARTNFFYLDDGSGETKIYLRSATGIKKPTIREGDWLEVVGIVSQYDDEYRVSPRYQDDIVVLDLEINETKSQKNFSTSYPKSSLSEFASLFLNFLSRRSAIKYFSVSFIFLVIVLLKLTVKIKK